jgi:hypothetical protein
VQLVGKRRLTVNNPIEAVPMRAGALRPLCAREQANALQDEGHEDDVLSTSRPARNPASMSIT